MAYEKDAFVDPAVTEVAFYASHAYGNFTRTAAPTWENPGTNLAAADSLGDNVAIGGLAVDVLDGQRKLRLDVDSDSGAGPTEVWRIDLDLDSLIEADFAIIDNHTLRDAYDEAIRNQIDIYHDANATFNGSTALAPTKFFSGLLGKGRPYILFDGDSDYVSVADDADLDFGASPFSIEFIAKVNSHTNQGSVWNTVISKGTLVGGPAAFWSVTYMNDGKLVFAVDGTSTAKSDSSVMDSVWRHYVCVRAANGTQTMYINGVAQSDTGSSTQNVDNASALEIGRDGAARNADCDFSLIRPWNRALSAAEALARYSGWTHTPIPVADQYGASTELMPNQVDRDFSGASAWTNVDIDTYDEAGDLTITALAADQYCELAVASAPMTVTYHYRLFFDVANIVNTWAIKDFTGAQILGTVTADGTDQYIDFTVDAGLTGGLRIVAVGSDSSADFDNFSLIRTGCVAEWAPDGIQSGESRWRDSSINGLDGTITGATAKDEPTTTNGEGDCTIIEFTEVEKQYWFWVFNVDTATSDADTEIGQIALGKKFTCAVRPNLDIVKLDGYGLSGRETLGGRRSVNYRHGKRRGWQLNWSYVSQAEYENFQRFFDIIETTKDSSKCPWSRYPFWFTLNNDGNEPAFYFGRVMGVPEIRELTYEAYAISVVIETEV